jgi:hypothetical protein
MFTNSKYEFSTYSMMEKIFLGEGREDPTHPQAGVWG